MGKILQMEIPFLYTFKSVMLTRPAGLGLETGQDRFFAVLVLVLKNWVRSWSRSWSWVRSLGLGLGLGIETFCLSLEITRNFNEN